MFLDSSLYGCYHRHTCTEGESFAGNEEFLRQSRLSATSLEQSGSRKRICRYKKFIILCRMKREVL